jgi:4,5-DOPA dioxygenase extradiol
MNDKNRMPVFFIGHGSPMNALANNKFTQSLNALGLSLVEKPAAILVVSAHWLTEGTFVGVTEKPDTIYDFYGFPDELYRIKYPAPGSPEFAGKVKDLIPDVNEDDEWGLDHGAWAILKHLFPNAEIPVFQLSIDFYKPMQFHFSLAKKLAVLREKGVLVIGSGNIVHNLALVRMQDGSKAYDWAVDFDEWVKDRIKKRDLESLINYEQQGQSAKLSVPTVDHYVPLLYSLALADEDDKIEFTYEEIVYSSLSMRCLRIG